MQGNPIPVGPVFSFDGLVKDRIYVARPLLRLGKFMVTVDEMLQIVSLESISTDRVRLRGDRDPPVCLSMEVDHVGNHSRIDTPRDINNVRRIGSLSGGIALILQDAFSQNDIRFGYQTCRYFPMAILANIDEILRRMWIRDILPTNVVELQRCYIALPAKAANTAGFLNHLFLCSC